jgi:hypothetical protein
VAPGQPITHSVLYVATSGEFVVSTAHSYYAAIDANSPEKGMTERHKYNILVYSFDENIK